MQKKDDRIRFVLLLTLCLGSLSLFAQVTDSIPIWKERLKNASSRDSFFLLEKIGWECVDGEVEKAIETGKQLEEIARRLKDERLYSDAAHLLGGAYGRIADYENGLHYNLEYLRISEKRKDSANIASAHNNIGSLYHQYEKFDLAEKNYLTAIQIWSALGDERSLAKAYSNISDIQSQKKDFTKALDYINKALFLKRKHNNVTGTGISLYGLASVLYNMTKNDAALDTAKKALLILEKSDNIYFTIQTKILLANIYKDKKDYTHLLLIAEPCLEQAKNADDNELVLQLYQLLADGYSAKKDFKSAYRYEQLHHALYAEMLNAQEQGKILEIQTKYETVKKDDQIKLLHAGKEITELQLEKNRQALRNFWIFAAVGVLLLLTIGTALFKIRRSNNKLTVMNRKIVLQKEQIEEKNKEITDSIRYGKRIQQAFLTTEKQVAKYIPEFFIFFKPKDIVSGDFYWATFHKDHFYLVTADCTGHGVPGAFMSMIGINLLNDIIIKRDISNPGLILDVLREEIIHALNPEGHTEESKDGMDMVLFKFNTQSRQAEYAAANNSFYQYSETNWTIHKADKMPVGMYSSEIAAFNKRTITVNRGDILYFITDGFADQFGGPRGKKFKYKSLEELLQFIAKESMPDQKQKLESAFNGWKGSAEQTDDVTVIGIKIP